MTFTLIAHRGFSSAAPENTLAAFDLALESGFPNIELDAQLTTDGFAVVIHDETLDRTTDGSGAVAKSTLGEIKGLDAGSWFPNADERGYVALRVPTLDEVLLRYQGRAHLYLEMKSDQPELPGTVAELLLKRDWLRAPGTPEEVPGVTIISFHLEHLGRSQEFLPEVRHGWLVAQLDPVDVRLARRLDVDGIFPHVQALTKDSVEWAHSAGAFVGAWGLSSPDDLARAVQAGAFGAAVDGPASALEFLRNMGAA